MSSPRRVRIWPRLLKRPDTSRTGTYILLSEDPDSLGGSLAYIGEGDEVRTRLRQHARAEEQGGKDFWDSAIVLTSKYANLTKAHARYLESRLITLAQQASRARLINGTGPAPLPLPEADVSDMGTSSPRPRSSCRSWGSAFSARPQRPQALPGRLCPARACPSA